MGCMKCGRDTPEDRLFCDECLAVMEKYPVKPNIAVQLPQRKETSAIKRPVQPRRRILTMEDRMQRLKRRARTFLILWLVTLALLAATIYPTVQYFFGDVIHQIGQNYSTFTTIETTEP